MKCVKYRLLGMTSKIREGSSLTWHQYDVHWKNKRIGVNELLHFKGVIVDWSRISMSHLDSGLNSYIFTVGVFFFCFCFLFIFFWKLLLKKRAVIIVLNRIAELCLSCTKQCIFLFYYSQMLRLPAVHSIPVHYAIRPEFNHFASEKSIDTRHGTF